MTQPQVFVETNFLFGVFRMPSKRHRDALALKAQFGAGDIKSNHELGVLSGERRLPVLGDGAAWIRTWFEGLGISPKAMSI